MFILKKKHEAEVEALKAEIDKQKSRVKEVEDLFEEKNKIKLRTEVTEVKCVFNKLEMAVITAGINKLVKDVKNSDDAKFYFALLDKINDVIGKMKEDSGV